MGYVDKPDDFRVDCDHDLYGATDEQEAAFRTSIEDKKLLGPILITADGKPHQFDGIKSGRYDCNYWFDGATGGFSHPDGREWHWQFGWKTAKPIRGKQAQGVQIERMDGSIADMPPAAPPPAAGQESLEQAVSRLSQLKSLEYERAREGEAKKLGVRVGALDAAIKDARIGSQVSSASGSMFPHVELHSESVDGEELLNELLDTIRRFIICEPETAIAAALWIAFTWVIDKVQVAPLAVITAPEKRCGKTQLLSLIGRLSYRPLLASNISPAAVYRVIEAHRPTLLIDEADSFFKENEELRGVINSGHTRQSAYVIRTVGDEHEPKQFSTWGAKAISGIGHLAETLMDRAVKLELRRKRPNESVARLRHAAPGLFEQLASRLARYARDISDDVAAARPQLPDALNDRAQDNWEPLLAIADIAGGAWPRLARDAALKISGSEQEAVSLSTELLGDIQEIFEERRVDRITTNDLLEALMNDELKPWATYNRGLPMKPRQLAKRLEEYSIQPQTIRVGVSTKKGYYRAAFEDAFARYISASSETPEKSVTTSQHARTPHVQGVSRVTEGLSVTVTPTGTVTPKAPEIGTCDVVTDKFAEADGRIVEGWL